MSSVQEEDETQKDQKVDGIEEDDLEETQDLELEETLEETQDQEMETLNEEPDMETAEAEPETIQPKKREKREPVALVREPGKTLLPFARVQKIIKADKEIPIVAREATFLIALATEEFIKRLCEAGQQVAHREKRSTIQHRDLAAVSRRADEFVFLEEIIPLTSSTTTDPQTKRSKPVKARDGKATLLDQFVGSKKAEEDDDDGDIIMNEDGTMYGGKDPVDSEYDL